jgi:hypothetical protein
MLQDGNERDSGDVGQLVEKIGDVDEGEEIICELSSPLTHNNNEHSNAQFTVETRINNDLSRVPGKTGVTELNLYGHALNGDPDSKIEAWSLTVKERRDGTPTTPMITGDCYDPDEGGYLSTRAAEVVSIKRIDQTNE